MFNKFELIGGGVCVGLMALAIYLIQVQAVLEGSQEAQPAAVSESRVQVVSTEETAEEVSETITTNNTTMTIDDITIGEGKEVQSGDTVSVHYAGRLQDGAEFDNSKKRGAPFEFQVGGGQVIAGWEEGLIGMKVGGERVLVIPPEKAYGERGIGPIPPNATLVFTIELLAIN